MLVLAREIKRIFAMKSKDERGRVEVTLPLSICSINVGRWAGGVWVKRLMGDALGGII